MGDPDVNNWLFAVGRAEARVAFMPVDGICCDRVAERDNIKRRLLTMKDEIVLYQPDAEIQLEVRLQDETVWLTQQQMAMLFGVKENNITYHIQGI